MYSVCRSQDRNLKSSTVIEVRDQDWENYKTTTCKTERLWKNGILLIILTCQLLYWFWVYQKQGYFITYMDCERTEIRFCGCYFSIWEFLKKSIEFDNWSIQVIKLLILDTFQAGMLSFLPHSTCIRLPIKKRLKISHFV